jgi:uncharacterized protein YdeI (YjbR/CyaY-like superfamily)
VGRVLPEALDEALCFGWIDGIRKKAGADSYTSRLTPRRTGSIWSLVNIRHVERLVAAGKMQPSGLKAFAARQAHKTGVYAFEQKPQKLPAAYEKNFAPAERPGPSSSRRPHGISAPPSTR